MQGPRGHGIARRSTSDVNARYNTTYGCNLYLLCRKYVGKNHQQTGEEEEEKEVWSHRFDRESEEYPLLEQLRPQRAIPAYQMEYWEGW